MHQATDRVGQAVREVIDRAGQRRGDLADRVADNGERMRHRSKRCIENAGDGGRKLVDRRRGSSGNDVIVPISSVPDAVVWRCSLCGSKLHAGIGVTR